MGCGGSKDTTAQEKGSPRRASNSPAKKGNNASGPEDKYMVNGSSSPSNSANSEAPDKGFKRRLREKLRAATAGHDTEVLQKAMDRFQRHNLEDCGDFTKAQDRMEFLKLRRDLRDGVRRSHVGVLERTISDAEKSKFASQLHNQIQAARRKLQHLKELNEYSHDILNMEQTTISEIHSYQRPPACVHDVMAASYMLLGYPEPRLTEWGDIQILLCRVGKESLIHGVRHFDSANTDPQTTGRVRDILRPHDLHTVRQGSNGAATFYVWATQICDKVERDQKEEEDRLRQQEMDRQTHEENDTKNPKNKNSRKPKGWKIAGDNDSTVLVVRLKPTTQTTTNMAEPMLNRALQVQYYRKKPPSQIRGDQKRVQQQQQKQASVQPPTDSTINLQPVSISPVTLPEELCELDNFDTVHTLTQTDLCDSEGDMSNCVRWRTAEISCADRESSLFLKQSDINTEPSIDRSVDGFDTKVVRDYVVNIPERSVHRRLRDKHRNRLFRKAVVHSTV